MLGFDLDIWDYLTFATFALAGIAFMLSFLWFAGLPGRIALARDHPEAEAVNLLGWAGVLPTIYPWIQAFIWAFKPTDVIDIRRFPREEAAALARERARRSRKGKPSSTAVSSRPRRVGH
jgi:Protein of unknown function (DUF3302)